MIKKKQSKRNYKNYIIPIILTIVFLGVIGVFATSIITNNEGSLNLNGQNRFTIFNYSSINGINITGNVNEIANVKIYGAVGNGITDDTLAIQKAINASKTVYFPQGTYKINSSAIQAPDNRDSSFIGESRQVSKIYLDRIIGFIPGDNSSFTFKNLQFYSNGDYTTPKMAIFGYDGDYGIIPKYVDYEITDNEFYNLTSAFRAKNGLGIVDRDSGSFIFERNIIHDFNDQISSGKTYEVVAYYDMKEDENVVRIKDNYVYNIFKNESKALNYQGQNYTEAGSDYTTSYGIIVSGNVIQNVSSDAIYIGSSKYVSITGNIIKDYGQTTLSHIQGITAGCSNGLIEGNIVDGGNGRALRIEGSKNVIVKGNTFKGGKSGGNIAGIHRFLDNQNITFEGNILESYQEPMFYFENTSLNILIKNNFILGDKYRIGGDFQTGHWGINDPYRNIIADNFIINQDSSLNENLINNELAISLNFDLSSNNKSLDSSINEYDLSEYNVLHCYNCGVYGTGTYIFNGTNYLTNPHDNNLELGNANSNWTIMLWIYRNNGVQLANPRYAQQSGSAGGWSITGYSGGDGILLTLTNKSNSNIGLETLSTTITGGVKNEEWIHYTWTSDGNQWKFYRNGIFVSNRTITSSDNITGISNFFIGGIGSTGINGSIDDFRIYHRALNYGEINKIVNNKIVVKDSYLLRSGGTIQGVLTFAQPPVACPTGSYMTYFNGITSTCTTIGNSPITNLNVTGNVTSNLIPQNGWILGSSILRWLKLFVQDIDASGTINGTRIEAQTNYSVGGVQGFTGSGTSCVISEIKGGIITAAVCT